MTPNPTPTPTWLITGASSGFGLSLTRVALSAGHNVIATSRQTPSPDSPLHTLLTTHPSRCRHLPLDITSPPSTLTYTLTTAYSLFGDLTHLVNCAGTSLIGALEDIPLDLAHAQFETNFFGPLKLMQAALPHMRARCAADGHQRHIINVSSGAGIISRPALSMYAASKHAFEAMSESLAQEVKPFGIRMLIVQPGLFRTPFLKRGGTHVPVGEAYREGAVGKTVEWGEGIQKMDEGELPGGDPEKAAKAIFEVVMGIGRAEGRREVLRLPLGQDSVDRMREWVGRFLGDVEEMEDIAGDTRFDGEEVGNPF
ncbi:MAG: hypothetical protein Q9227_001784 [Pyrenula ochraceoflavens]